MRRTDGIWWVCRGFSPNMSRASDTLRSGQGSRACGGEALDTYLETFVLAWNHAKDMWRALTKVFWLTIAAIFVIEAWLWDRLEPIVETCVAWLPLRWLKALVAEQVADL